MFYFPGDLVGPDPSSAVLPSVLYFPGLMQARRLRLHRHRCTDWSCWTCWSSPLSSNYYFQAGGAPSRPWQKSYLFPEIWIHPGTPLCSSQVFSSGVHCGCSCLVFAASCIIFSGLRGPSALTAKLLTVSVIYLVQAYRVRIKSVRRSVICS
jgi:hypothetical protein